MKYLLILTSTLFLLSCTNENLKKEDTFTNDKNKVLIEKYFSCFNKHDWKGMSELYTENPEMKDPSYGTKSVKMSKAEIIKKYEELNKMIPNVKDSVINTYFTGNSVIVEFESSGIGPDNIAFTLPICTVFEITNGKISKDLTYYDNFEQK